MKATIVLEMSKHLEMRTHTEYVAGAIIALLILGYLIYTLIKPEKF
jgi:K+-transporting ATPase KdpF subunit